ncbi:phage holin family protein [Candidatus Gottesmanbacteria bacterium]|nr:phage holin family protein [Candidatus Gottesmanbacteria bacterium]
MRYLARMLFFNMFGLWLASQILPTIRISGNWLSLVAAGAVLSILMLFVKPILRIIFLPINIITFGLLSWLVNVIVLYLLTVLVFEVTIVPWTFPGAAWSGFVIPNIKFSYTTALILSSLLVTLITNALHDVSES